jgi:hypothetical protein
LRGDAAVLRAAGKIRADSGATANSSRARRPFRNNSQPSPRDWFSPVVWSAVASAMLAELRIRQPSSTPPARYMRAKRRRSGAFENSPAWLLTPPNAYAVLPSFTSPTSM